ADCLADRLVIVDGGRVVAEGTPEKLKGELRGDALHIELLENPEGQQARTAIAALASLREITLDGSRLSARAADGAAAIPAALAALDQHGIKVATVTVARPSLDDVYLRHAGRRMEAAA